MNNEDIFKHIPDIISTLKSGWTKNYSARNNQGGVVRACDKDAVCWCFIGAIDKVLGPTIDDKYYIALKNCLYEKTIGLGPGPRRISLAIFNDTQESVDPIIQLLEYLISPEVID